MTRLHSSVRRWSLCALLLLVAACAPQADRIASVGTPARTVVDDGTWAFERSDIPVEPQYRFGRLDNGMRYVVRSNATPKGTAIVRMVVRTGSLDEREDERGFAHFVEHMAFNGSTRVPEGEMVRLLERKGLAFGADTNASTGFEATTYKLDLPVNDPELLDTALMLMRETASELSFDPQAVARERGVVLAERRDRNDWRMRNSLDESKFMHPRALYPDRFPIGVTETLATASAEALKAFWQREYVPRHTTVMVIGDFPPDAAEAAIRSHFASWQEAPVEPQPDGGPIAFGEGGRSAIWIDPAQANRVTAEVHGTWLDEPDSISVRKEKLLRQIGYGIVNRRFERLSNQVNAPFRAAGFGTGDVFKAGRSTRLVVDVIERRWQRALDAAVLEYRRAMQYGFSDAEVAEQVANIRRSVENAAAGADTRSHGAFEGAVYALLNDGLVPSDPVAVRDRFNAFAPTITARRVLAALKREALSLDDPLLRYRGRNEIEGGEQALRRQWEQAMRAPLTRGQAVAATEFAYDTFGPPGTVISDRIAPGLDIREIRFANGVMLNLKRTALEREAVLVEVNIDGGDRLATRDDPMAVSLMRDFSGGGLGRHSDDELASILAGKTVQAQVRSDAETFVWNARTTPADLDLQLALIAAYVTDPGYRQEGVVRFRHYINNYFAQRLATPGSALGAAIGGILSDNDPRFTLGAVEDYRKLDFTKLKDAISDRLAKGAIEVAIVGDVDEQAAIDAVARTLGALPSREAEFRVYPDQRRRSFTSQRGRQVVRHQGPADQAQVRFVWPTRDDDDAREATAFSLLERVVRIELTDTLREKLGKAYSPGASSSLTRSWDDYGTFAVAASVDVADIAETRAAIVETIAALRSAPVDNDVLRRARQPVIEMLDNLLKSNAGIMAFADRAQSESDRISRLLSEKDRLLSLGASDVQALASRHLAPAAAVEVLVLPEGVTPPSP